MIKEGSEFNLKNLSLFTKIFSRFAQTNSHFAKTFSYEKEAS